MPVKTTTSPESSRLLTPLTESDLAHFKKLTSQHTELSDYPTATEVSNQIPIFDGAPTLDRLRSADSEGGRVQAMDDIQRALLSGPGILVMRGMIDSGVIDRAQAVADELSPPAVNRKEGENSRRIFGYLDKHAKTRPESFAEYYGNEILAAVCEAWLGPSYQVTASINATSKGGAHQPIHRDYHVSHQALDRIYRFPVAKQIASQFLTLQCAIAHTDMPQSTGPTCFMPYSQLFEKGYIAVRDPGYLDYIRPSLIQLELQKGDAVFFNPLTFHQPGVNTTDKERIANLLQVSSAFGRSMESCDRVGMTKAMWPEFKRLKRDIGAGKSKMTEAELEAAIAAACSDYGYPKIMDQQTPGAPPTQAELVKQHLAQDAEDEAFHAALEQFQTWHLP